MTGYEMPDQTKERWADGRAMQDRFQREELEIERQFGFACRTLIGTAAGALALSVGAFVREPLPQLAGSAIAVLRIAWALLFASIGLGSLSLILRYAASQRSHSEWECREQHRQAPSGISGKAWRSFSLLALLATFVAFLSGLGALAWVAVSLLER